METSIQCLVSDLKKEIFEAIMNDVDDDDSLSHSLHGGLMSSASAYDTAWVAMVPTGGDISCLMKNDDSSGGGGGPMFESCLKWIVENQEEDEGFWGETNEEGLPTIDALTSTLACLLALHKWNSSTHNHHHHHIHSGLNFIKSKAEIILKINYQNLPQWFLLTFPALVEQAEAAGLSLDFPPGITSILPDMFAKRRRILALQTDSSGVKEKCQAPVSAGLLAPPLTAYMETLPPRAQSDINVAEIVEQHLSKDGSIEQSPSATAGAFLATGNPRCIKYLQSVIQTFPHGGVPARYPSDGDLIKMVVVDHVHGLGVAHHFEPEIAQILSQIFRNQRDDGISPKTPHSDITATKLFKDAMAFRLLRMQGYSVNPQSFCWFLYEPQLLTYMEENSEQFITAMYSVYRATDFSFPGEKQMDQARTLAIQMLNNSHTRNRDLNMLISKGLHNMIKYELNVPWSARLEHLYHRKWIEENEGSHLWMGKASFYRLPFVSNKKLTKLAVQNFEYLQSIYRIELEELKGWSKKWGLSEMGFGREKTVYTYFAVAATSCLPYSSIMRLLVAKSAIIVTVADDFYDMDGSLTELENLTDAVKRWDGKGLKGHGRTIFDALDDFVNHIAVSCCYEEQGRKMLLSKLQDIWRETFNSWMVERAWSLMGYLPSKEEYLGTGMVSIAAHTIALPATSLLSQSESLKPSEYRNITILLMTLCRLINDIQSYQKEQVDGKMNLVLLHLKENPNMKIEDSIAYIEQMIEAKKKEFMEHVFMDNDMPKLCKQVHLSSMKVFQMFFNSANLFDSETALLEDVKKAIYLPIRREPISKPFLKPLPIVPSQKTKTNGVSKISSRFRPIWKHPICTSSIRHPLVKNSFAAGEVKVHMSTKFNPCFIFK